MATPSLYRFRIDLSNIDQGIYDRLDFRMVIHPSENHAYLLTRMLAYALNAQEGLKFSAEGLGDPDAPPISLEDPRGGLSLWIDIGNPSARRMHKATKAARRVMIYTYKNPEILIAEIQGGNIFQGEKIEVFSLPEEFLTELEANLERDNTWSVLLSDGALTVGAGSETITGELGRHDLSRR
ncbi:MAG: YaeQ family protein [Proteobacteria bacterium]|nr:MAG: YaeQ family protein [Pseudomonadota bacterium]